MNEYIKDFDKWNEIKKATDSRILPIKFFFREQEIWWCSLGVNIGSEEDGKNDLFERPVLIIRKISKDIVLIAPLTSKIRVNNYRINTVCAGVKSQILLAHCRMISSQRLLRKIGYVKLNIFQKTIIEIAKVILGDSISETPP